MAPDSPRKPEASRSRVFETHIDDAKPTGFRRYINVLAICIPVLIGLVLVIGIARSLREPAGPTPSTTAASTPSAPAPADSAPRATTPKPVPAAVPATQPATQPATLQPASTQVPPPPAPPAPQPSADQVVTLPAEVTMALKISGDDPQYPAIAKAAGIQGLVVLDATISKSGAIEDVRVVSGPPLLQTAARTFRYKPSLINGKPVTVHTQVNLNFKITTAAPQSK